MNDWYEQSFGKDYLTVYKHRDFQGAYEEVRQMIAWLKLPGGAEILDLCCGVGRHSLALADFGYQVTGMDLSKVLLNEAVKMDKRQAVKWLIGDMRAIPLTGPFDAVVNLFTSFGYFEDDEQNAAVLREISRVLRPNGKYMIDFMNPDYVRAHLVAESERSENQLRIVEKRSIAAGFVRKTIQIFEDGQDERSYLEQVKLYGQADFERMAGNAGLVIERTFGNYDGQVYDKQLSPRLIVIGRKSE